MNRYGIAQPQLTLFHQHENSHGGNGLQQDAMRKMASWRIGVFASISAKPCALSGQAGRGVRDERDHAGELAVTVDVGLNGAMDALQPFDRHADLFRLRLR